MRQREAIDIGSEAYERQRCDVSSSAQIASIEPNKPISRRQDDSGRYIGREYDTEICAFVAERLRKWKVESRGLL